MSGPHPAREPVLLTHTPRLAIVGVGSAGGSVLARIRQARVPRVDCIAIEADQFMQKTGVPPAERDDEVASALGEADLVLLIGDLGGRAVTRPAMLVAGIARAAGALTMAVVARPFAFEGYGIGRDADNSLRDIATMCDATIVISSDRSMDKVGRDRRPDDVRTCRDEAMNGAVSTIVKAVLVPRFVRVDFADVHALFKGRGRCVVGTGTASGPARAERAVRNALTCPFLGVASLGGAGGVLVQVAARAPDLSEVERACRTIWPAVGDETPVVVSDVAEPALGGAMRITLVVAGLPSEG